MSYGGSIYLVSLNTSLLEKLRRNTQCHSGSRSLCHFIAWCHKHNRKIFHNIQREDFCWIKPSFPSRTRFIFTSRHGVTSQKIWTFLYASSCCYCF